MNWGKGIILSFTLFIGFIVVLAIGMMRQKVDLVSNSYYEEGIEYEKRQNAKANFDALMKPISIKAEDGSIELIYPDTLLNCAGNVLMYRPSDRNLDRKYPMMPDSLGAQRILTQDLVTGRWVLQFDIKCDGRDYHHQAYIYLQ